MAALRLDGCRLRQHRGRDHFELHAGHRRHRLHVTRLGDGSQRRRLNAGGLASDGRHSRRVARPGYRRRRRHRLPVESGLVGATCHYGLTSNLITTHPRITDVLPLGDDQYDCRDYQLFLNFFGPTWGSILARFHPIPGNHEYLTYAPQNPDGSQPQARSLRATRRRQCLAPVTSTTETESALTPAVPEIATRATTAMTSAAGT
jgi:hypothetical protein